MTGKPTRLILNPHPFRKIGRGLLKRSRLGSYTFRLTLGAVERPNYAYVVYQAAPLASRLGCPKISVLESGVGRGAGLRSLEEHAEQVSKLLPAAQPIQRLRRVAASGAGMP